MLDRASVAVVAGLVVAAAHLAAEGRARVASLVELELQGLNALSPVLDFLFDFVEEAGSGVVFNAGGRVARSGALERRAVSLDLGWAEAATVLHLAH